MSYSGVCFITTSRGTIDQSVNSVIDIPLDFKGFTTDTRRQI